MGTSVGKAPADSARVKVADNGHRINPLGGAQDPENGPRLGQVTGPSTSNAFLTTTVQPLSIVSNFTGQDYYYYYPPDVQIASGPSSLVEAVNSLVAVYTTQGVLIKSTILQSFFNTNLNDGVYDSKVIYDTSSQTWFLSSEDFTTGSLYLAVSKTSDPTGSWWTYQFSATSGCPDQPILGVSDDKIAVSVNDYSDCNFTSYLGAQYWIFNKSDLLNGQSVYTYSLPDSSLFSVHPAQALSPTSTLYMITDSYGYATTVRIFSITGVPPGALSISTADLPISEATVPPKAPQLGSTYPLDTFDARVLDAKWDKGILWVSLNDGCVPTGDNQTRSCIRLIQIDTRARKVIQDFDLGSPGQYYLYGALSPDSIGNLLVTFGYSSPSRYPGLMVTSQVLGDPLDSLEQPLVLTSGTGPETTFCTIARGCRYGDYFEAAQDPLNPSIVWAAGQYGTSSETWATTIAALSIPPLVWQAVGPRGIPNAAGSPSLAASGKLQAFAVSYTDPNIMYTGGGVGPRNSGPLSEAGLYMTINGGADWVPADNGLTDPTVDAVWLDQQNPNILLAGTWFSGIYRSSDAGAHWNLTYTSSGFMEVTSFLQVNSSLYASTAQGILTSNDLGLDWSTLVGFSFPARALAQSNGDFYAGLDDGTVVSNSTGTWQTILSEPSHTVWSVAANSTNPMDVFVVEWFGYQSPDIFESQNAGGTWSAVALPPGTFPADAAQYVELDASHPGTVYVGADGYLYKSTDAARTFTTLPLKVDVRLIESLSNGNLLVGSDQGLYVSSDGGSSWSTLSGRAASSLLTSFAVNGSTIFSAVQDFSPIYSFDGGQTWLQLNGTSPTGEDGMVLFNPADPSYVYVYTTAGFEYSTDGGQHFQLSSSVQGGLNFRGDNNLIAVDPNSPSTVYVSAANGIYKSTDYGVSFTLESWPFAQPSLIAVDPANSQRIFVGDSGLYLTSNDGGSWSQSSIPGASGYPTTIALDPLNSSVIMIGLSGPTEANGGVWRSENGGTSFSPVNDGLVSMPMLTGIATWDLAFEPSTQNLAVATTHGVYLSQDLGTDWQNVTANAVPYWFTGVSWTSNYLYASTYGEGLLRLAIGGFHPLSASIAYKPNPPALRETVTLTANVSGGTSPYSLGWDLGDASTSTGNDVVHIYGTSGLFNVLLIVTDKSHDSVIVSGTINVMGGSGSGGVHPLPD